MKTVKLSSLCNILSGFAFKSESFGEDGLPIVRIRDVVRGYSETYYSGDYDEKYILDDGDILVGMDGDFNTAYWNGGRALLNQRVCKIEVDSTKACKKFIYYFLPLELKKIWDETPFVTVKHLSAKKIADIDVPDWPLETQKKIGVVLEKADQLRKDCLQMEQELNSLAQSVFIDMFGDPVTNPKGWKLASLSSLGVVNGGLQVTSKRSGNPISVPYLRVANVYRDFLKLDEVKDILVTSKELERAMLEKGDILFVEGHGNANELGRAAVWNNEVKKCVHQNHLIRFRPGAEIRPQYVSSFVNSAAGKRQLLSMSKTTSGLNTLSASNISSLKVLVPPLKLQDKYLGVVAEILKQKNNNSLLASELDAQFNVLMQKAFSGELNFINLKTK